MKTLINLLKWVIFSIITISMLSTKCEKDEPISGDSYLKVINDCNVSIKIYFDDAKLGSISSDKDETWSVPSGTHAIKATCSFYEDYEGSHKFYSGKTTTIRVEINDKGKCELIKQSE